MGQVEVARRQLETGKRARLAEEARLSAALERVVEEGAAAVTYLAAAEAALGQLLDQVRLRCGGLNCAYMFSSLSYQHVLFC